jgi:hypothetical protein
VKLPETHASDFCSAFDDVIRPGDNASLPGTPESTATAAPFLRAGFPDRQAEAFRGIRAAIGSKQQRSA